MILKFLPPAFVVCGEGNSFSLIVCPHPGGTYPGRSGTYPGQIQTGGYPKVPPAKVGNPSQGKYPPPPGQVRIGGYPKVSYPPNPDKDLLHGI